MVTKPETLRLLEERKSPEFYFDVLALAVAKTRSTQFKADLLEWNQVIYDFKEQIKDEAPELLRYVCFDTSRPPLSPLSEEVEQFLSVMRMSRSMVWAPDYSEYRINEAVKRRIVTDYSPKLQDWEDLIDELARKIDEKLAKHPPQGR